MQAHCTHIQGLLVPLVVQVVIAAALADIGAHAYAVQQEVHLPPERGTALIEEPLHVRIVGGIGTDNARTNGFRQLVDLSHPHGDRSVGEHDGRSFSMGKLGYLPCDALVVQCT